jgi:hypothetical protein
MYRFFRGAPWLMMAAVKSAGEEDVEEETNRRASCRRCCSTLGDKAFSISREGKMELYRFS